MTVGKRFVLQDSKNYPKNGVFWKVIVVTQNFCIKNDFRQNSLIFFPKNDEKGLIEIKKTSSIFYNWMTALYICQTVNNCFIP